MKEGKEELISLIEKGGITGSKEIIVADQWSDDDLLQDDVVDAIRSGVVVLIADIEKEGNDDGADVPAFIRRKMYADNKYQSSPRINDVYEFLQLFPQLNDKLHSDDVMGETERCIERIVAHYNENIQSDCGCVHGDRQSPYDESKAYKSALSKRKSEILHDLMEILHIPESVGKEMIARVEENLE